jgi:regulator of protease activity HflC (stomatin/prohibitin superfamily)
VQSEPPTDREDSIRFAEELIAVFEDELAELESLQPPEEREQAFDDYLAARREAIDLLEEGRDAAEENDPEGYADAQAEVAAGQVERAELAREAGLSDCSRIAGGVPPPG